MRSKWNQQDVFQRAETAGMGRQEPFPRSPRFHSIQTTPSWGAFGFSDKIKI